MKNANRTTREFATGINFIAIAWYRVSWPMHLQTSMPERAPAVLRWVHGAAFSFCKKATVVLAFRMRGHANFVGQPNQDQYLGAPETLVGPNIWLRHVNDDNLKVTRKFNISEYLILSLANF
jgi:hypothetical protein